MVGSTPVGEMMLARAPHRMICRIDANTGCDVGEFANVGIEIWLFETA
jgi:hypothetical protein